jgi:hypothetical protein
VSFPWIGSATLELLQLVHENLLKRRRVLEAASPSARRA